VRSLLASTYGRRRRRGHRRDMVMMPPGRQGFLPQKTLRWAFGEESGVSLLESCWVGLV
jgi:hypothetical protein